MAVHFEIKGRSEALASINIFQFDVIERVNKQLDQSSKNIRNTEKQMAPVAKTKGGAYKKSIKRMINRQMITAMVAPTAGKSFTLRRYRLNPIAHLLERGTASHPIHPYGDKSRTTQHPGTKPMPHIEPAWAKESGAFIAGVENAVKEARTK